MQLDIITASIVLLPACYAALLGFQFISGLVTLWRCQRPAPAPQMPAADHAAPADQPEQVAPAAPASLPAFIPNPAPTIYSDADRALVEAAGEAIARYWQQRGTDNVVPFVRPQRATQEAQQAHPALEGMTLRAMRELGARLKIRGARRWNTDEARATLAEYYQAAA